MDTVTRYLVALRRATENLSDPADLTLFHEEVARLVDALVAPARTATLLGFQYRD